ncbi:CsbD family protein [Litorisediminicola beolgyonensis]|uniref:CsbD family protein n=1 Tax=Litorisediminicola beolgyonensis TaxID=1173614 RepID=A0ABW3ZJI9_9RHOB
MNMDEIKGRWTEMKGKVREEWGELTDDEILETRGEREQMIGKLQARYGKTREEVEREFDSWVAKMKSDSGT